MGGLLIFVTKCNKEWGLFLECDFAFLNDLIFSTFDLKIAILDFF